MKTVRKVSGFVRVASPMIFIVLMVTSFALLALGGSVSLQRTITLMFLNMVLVISLYILAGNSGILPFGHAAFMAIGAYVTALVSIPPPTKAFTLPDLPHFLANAEVPSIPAVILSGAVAALFALVIAVPLMRLSGLTASLATFAVLVIVHVVASNWDSVTRGRGTMIGVPLTTGVWQAFLWVVVASLAAFVFQRSRVGMQLRASRDDEVAAKAVGIGVVRERVAAFTLSAFFAGLGGSLYAQFLGSFGPDAFFITITFTIIAMLVIGGIHALSGAVIGTVVVSVVSELLRHIEAGIEVGGLQLPGRPGLREVGLALLMILVLILRPRGITGGRELGLRLAREQPVPRSKLPAT